MATAVNDVNYTRHICSVLAIETKSCPCSVVCPRCHAAVGVRCMKPAAFGGHQFIEALHGERIKAYKDNKAVR